MELPFMKMDKLGGKCATRLKVMSLILDKLNVICLSDLQVKLNRDVET